MFTPKLGEKMNPFLVSGWYLLVGGGFIFLPWNLGKRCRGPERRTTNPWAAPMLVKKKVGFFPGSWGIWTQMAWKQSDYEICCRWFWDSWGIFILLSICMHLQVWPSFKLDLGVTLLRELLRSRSFFWGVEFIQRPWLVILPVGQQKNS